MYPRLVVDAQLRDRPLRAPALVRRQRDFLKHHVEHALQQGLDAALQNPLDAHGVRHLLRVTASPVAHGSMELAVPVHHLADVVLLVPDGQRGGPALLLPLRHRLLHVLPQQGRVALHAPLQQVVHGARLPVQTVVHVVLRVVLRAAAQRHRVLQVHVLLQQLLVSGAGAVHGLHHRATLRLLRNVAQTVEHGAQVQRELQHSSRVR